MHQLSGSITVFKQAWLIIISVLILFISVQNTLKGQEEFKFEHYTIEDGLPGVNISWIIQDRQGFLWVGTGIGLARYDGNSFQVFKNDASNPNSLSDNRVRYIYEDSEDGLWIVTEKWVNFFDRKTGKFHRILGDLLLNLVYNLVEDSHGNIWMATEGKGLIWYEKSTGKHKEFKNIPNKNSISNDLVFWVHLDKSDNNILWLATANGLNCLNLENKKFTHYRDFFENTFSKEENLITHLNEDDKNNIWIGYENYGLGKFNKYTEKYTHYYLTNHNSGQKNSYINMVLPGPDGRVWLSGNFGLDCFDPIKEEFTQYKNDPKNILSIGNDFTNGMCFDSENNLWIGCWGFGLSKLNLNQNRFSQIKLNNQSIQNIQEIGLDESNNLWILTEYALLKKTSKILEIEQYLPEDKSIKRLSQLLVARNKEIWIVAGNEIILFDLQKKKLIRYSHFSLDTSKFNPLSTVVIGDIMEDSKGNIWFGTFYDLYKKEVNEDSFVRQNALPSEKDYLDMPTIIKEDRFGKIWIAKRNSGLFNYDPNLKKTIHYKHNPQNVYSLSDDYIQSIYKDANGSLWVSTIKGSLECFDPETEKFKLFFKKDIFRPIQAIIEDQQGDLWLGTLGQGVIKFSKKNNSLRFYRNEDGLIGSTFPVQTPVQNKETGEIFLENGHGLIAFDPIKIRDYSSPPPVFIVNLIMYQKNQNNGELEEIKMDLIGKREIRISYKQDILTFGFSVLSFSKAKQNRYTYQLKGFSDDWIQLNTKHDQTFTNLPPGTYTLRVKGSNGDGYWNETPAELKIIITPPWYWSWPTKILYGLILVSVLYGIYRFQLRRRLAEAETFRLRELDDLKTRLYTNITHEFRTPLTVILGMVKNIRTDTKRWLEEGLQMIQRNGQNLLRLVNQMLDLSKLESGAMSVHMIQGDMIAYLKYLTESFHSFAESREVSLHFISDHEELMMDYDPDKILNIVSNLLSNALKFTPPGGSVYLQVGKQENSDLPIQVRDTGAGIPADKLPHVFDRFYQADDSATRQGEGTGIGLALTRELVQLLEGRIEVKSRVGQGSVFTVWLPVRHEAPLPGEMPEGEVILSEVTDGVGQIMDFVPGAQDEDRPLALIVEDNEDVVRYLSGCLEGNYRLAVARDGQEGIEKAEELVPDIVISDVMMPRKDGFELCDTLKHNRLTSHIPVVLLTAKADAASRISGLRRGADAYLAKPFDEEELLVILEKQLELRKTLQARYSSSEFPAKKDPKPAEPSTILEDEFILRIRSIIERRLADYDLDVPQLCQEMATSRTQLHNKLKALTGKSATEYIRWIRLAKARELLLTTDLNISEIAYQCGFQLPHYFTRVFTEAEGCSPTEYRNNNIKL